VVIGIGNDLIVDNWGRKADVEENISSGVRMAQ